METIEPAVIHSSATWLAISKPRGMSIHNRKGSDLISWVAANFDAGESFHPLHRLDTPTSGLVLMAKSKATAQSLHAAFENRTVKKTYLAVARSVAKADQAFQEGTSGEWTWSLTKRAEGRRDPRGYAPMRVKAKTIWRVEQALTDRVVLRLEPETGRKHQLRRHAAIAGIPLVGDRRYGSADDPSDRLCLHATRLEFTDPETGTVIEISCPPPDDFYQLD